MEEQTSIRESDKLTLGAAYAASVLGLPTAGLGTVLAVLVAAAKLTTTAHGSDARAHAKAILAKNLAVLGGGAVILAVLWSWIFVKVPTGQEFWTGAGLLGVYVAIVLVLKAWMVWSAARLLDGKGP